MCKRAICLLVRFDFGGKEMLDEKMLKQLRENKEEVLRLLTADELENEHVLEIAKAMDKAEESDRPYLIGNKVFGDTSKARKSVADYTIEFQYPKEMIEGKLPENHENYFEFGNWVKYSVTYKDIFVDAMKHWDLAENILKLQPLFELLDRKQEDETEFTIDEVLDVMTGEKKKVRFALYHIIGDLLDLSNDEKRAMRTTSVVNAFTILTNTNPEIFNESKAFFS